jgi:hypothetical protein
MPIDTLRLVVIGLAAYVAVGGVVLYFVRRHGIEILMATVAVNMLLFYAERHFGDLSPHQLNRWATWIQVHQFALLAFYVSEKLYLKWKIHRVNGGH